MVELREVRVPADRHRDLVEEVLGENDVPRWGSVRDDRRGVRRLAVACIGLFLFVPVDILPT